MSETKDKFIEYLIKELNHENKIRLNLGNKPVNVCFIVSIIDKEIENCNEFIKDITDNEYIIYVHLEPIYYTDGYCDIGINNMPYYYRINFLFREKFLGYCMCSPEDSLYNKAHKCIGINCDWSAPAFEIAKIEPLGSAEWNEYQKEYWKYEEEFKQKENNIIKEIEDYEKKQRVNNIKDKINKLQQELNMLHDVLLLE